MAKGYEVLEMLIPQGGWGISGDDYEGIQFLECDPISKEEFEKGFEKYDEWKKKQDIANQVKKESILNRLGITEEEAKLLLS